MKDKTKQKEIFLSVVIPAYNEEVNIKRGVLESVYEYLKNKDFTWEVLLLDDGSHDDTAKVLGEFSKKHNGFRFLKEPHRGKGGTIIKGSREAKGEYILFTDMDQSTPIDQFDKFLPKIDKGYDVVIGSRSGRPGQSPIRKLMAYGLSTLRTIVLRLPYKDTQCGFKCFSRKAAKKIFSKMVVFRLGVSKSQTGSVTAAFDLEVLFVARKSGLKVASVPVEWYEYGERKEVSPIKDSWEGLRDLLKIRINAIKGMYK